MNEEIKCSVCGREDVPTYSEQDDTQTCAACLVIERDEGRARVVELMADLVRVREGRDQYSKWADVYMKESDKLKKQLDKSEAEIARWRRHSNCVRPDEISKALDEFNQLADKFEQQLAEARIERSRVEFAETFFAECRDDNELVFKLLSEARRVIEEARWLEHTPPQDCAILAEVDMVDNKTAIKSTDVLLGIIDASTGAFVDFENGDEHGWGIDSISRWVPLEALDCILGMTWEGIQKRVDND